MAKFQIICRFHVLEMKKIYKREKQNGGFTDTDGDLDVIFKIGYLTFQPSKYFKRVTGHPEYI